MGVAGLWDIIRPAGKQRSLTHLAVVDGFEANPSGKRGYRIGIDASIWFFHAAYGKEGENPELRTLFFRLTRLMNKPFLPLFVFDGPKRPSIKRGKRISGTSHWLTTGMKNMIEAFGFEWRTAPGEAEAELAYLNRIGVIDAVLSDDVDNFLFGAVTVIRNTSKTLSGNKSNPVKNSDGKEDDNHTVVYRSRDILEHEDITLTQGGLILIGLLSGGDYQECGLEGCGTVTAHGLAKSGFGDTLLEAALNLSEEELDAFLVTWRDEIRHELKTNSRGKMKGKKPALAKKIPDAFPDVEVLLAYTNPVTSQSEGKSKRAVEIDWDREPDLGRIAGLCELYFEWGVKEIIIKRFRTVLWPSAVLRILRRGALNIDQRGPGTPTRSSRLLAIGFGTPSKMINKHFSSGKESEDDESDDQLIVKIHSVRNHASTDGILEYRVEISPAQLVRLSDAGVKGIRPVPENDDLEDDEDDEEGEEGGKAKGAKKAPSDPFSNLRVWMPAVMVKLVEPGIVREYETVLEKRSAKKAGKSVGGSTTAESTAKPVTKSSKAKKSTAIVEESEEESDTLPTFTAPPALKASKLPPVPIAKPKPAPPAREPEGVKSLFPVAKRAVKSKPKASIAAPEASVPSVLREIPMPLYDGSDDSSFFEDPHEVIERMMNAKAGPSRLSVPPPSPPPPPRRRTSSTGKKTRVPPSPFKPGVVHTIDDSSDGEGPLPPRGFARTQSAPSRSTAGSYKATKHSIDSLPQVRQEPSLLEISSDEEMSVGRGGGGGPSKPRTSPFKKSKSMVTKSTHTRTEDFLPASFLSGGGNGIEEDDEDLDFGLEALDPGEAMEIYTSPAKHARARASSQSSDSEMQQQQQRPPFRVAKSPQKGHHQKTPYSGPLQQRPPSPSPMRRFPPGSRTSGIVIDISSDIGSPPALPTTSNARVRTLPSEKEKEDKVLPLALELIPPSPLPPVATQAKSMAPLAIARQRRQALKEAEKLAARKRIPIPHEEEQDISIIDLT